MFLQHGQTDLDPLCIHWLLWFLERYNVHVVKLGHKVFYANYVCVFIDIDQLKGKPMHNLVIIYYAVQELSIFANCYDYSTHLGVFQASCHVRLNLAYSATETSYTVGTWHRIS